MERNYELMVILSPKLGEDEASAQNESILSLIKETGGEIIKTDPWGKRMLAYPIEKITEAHYFVNYLNMDPAAVKGIKQQLNINEHVIRHMFVAKEK
ncbi:MAG: 30S ribosomal protein S6 [Candidatus Cloacimonetes bacterium]|nr:30S ribosomal protein S6 [Candidatus Cloacimonadota bacterium]